MQLQEQYSPLISLDVFGRVALRLSEMILKHLWS